MQSVTNCSGHYDTAYQVTSGLHSVFEYPETTYANFVSDKIVFSLVRILGFKKKSKTELLSAFRKNNSTLNVKISLKCRFQIQCVFVKLLLASPLMDLEGISAETVHIALFFLNKNVYTGVFLTFILNRVQSE